MADPDDFHHYPHHVHPNITFLAGGLGLTPEEIVANLVVILIWFLLPIAPIPLVRPLPPPPVQKGIIKSQWSDRSSTYNKLGGGW